MLAKTSDFKLLGEIERVWIIDLRTRHPDLGYNLCEGGEVGRRGLKNSDEHNKKIGMANKGRKPKGYVRTETHRQQLHDRMQGNDKGVKFTSDTAKKLAEGMTPEARKERARKAAQARWVHQFVEAG